jgi:hypothetical protein
MGMAGKRGLLGCLCAAAIWLGAAPAQAAFDDPLFTFTAPANVPPGSGFNGPCGIGVDTAANFYVSDYYHGGVDLFNASRSYITRLSNAGPGSGPCGLAIDSTGKLYVNDYHRAVVRYTPSPFPPNSTTNYFGALTIDSANPTGLAVHTGTGELYVDDRTYVAGYDSTGAAILDGGQPLKIGVGTLADGYGLGLSQFPSTAGRLYVADAATGTVKAYDPLVDKVNPAQTISGPPGGFNSLRDSAIAVDNVTGDVYVADRRSSPYSERPESTIQVFSSLGIYKGHLKYNVVDAAPVGLAVDNSAGPSQGRVYVTSGNTTNAAVIAYPPGAATTAPVLPGPSSIASVSAQQAGKAAAQSADDPVAGSASSSSPAASASEIAQRGNVRLDVSGELSPKKLPRDKAAPVSVSVGWKIATIDGAPPPKLKTLKIEINRAGRFDVEGLPTCPYAKIQPATTQRALANCRSALVGRGSFSALIGLAGQESYVAQGQMLVFNGLKGKQRVLFGQIYSARPFTNSFVITFELGQIGKGTYGTSLTAVLPPALRAWGSLTEIQMRLSRRFGYEGKQHSFLSAACPAPKGFTQVLFPLARTSFTFIGAESQSLILNRSCRARG